MSAVTADALLDLIPPDARRTIVARVDAARRRAARGCGKRETLIIKVELDAEGQVEGVEVPLFYEKGR